MIKYLVLFCFLFCGQAVAQSGWEQIDLPEEMGYTTDMAFISERIGFIAADGLWRTDDWGKHWYRIPARAEGVHALDSLRIYAVDVDGLFSVSRNGGETWEKSYIDKPCDKCRYERIFFVDTNWGYAAGGWWDWEGEGVRARTTDGGKIWTTYTFTDYSYRVTDLFFADTLRGLITTSHIYFTSDGGENWKQVHVQGQIHQIKDSFFLSEDYRSTDWGETWYYSGTPSGVTGGYREVLYGWYGRNVLKSIDSGNTWITQATIPYDSTPVDLVGVQQIVAPSRDVVYIRAGLRIYRTLTGGGPFMSVDRKSPHDPAVRSLSIRKGEPIVLSGSNKGYTLHNVVGAEVSRSEEATESIQTSDFSPGLYFLYTGEAVIRVLIY